MPKTKIAKEKEIVHKMIAIYCRGSRHGKGQLCPECAGLAAYASKRLDHCRFGEDKPFCKHCPVHCYNKDMQARIRTVMRYSGPRIMLYHPVAAAEHLVSSLVKRLPMSSDYASIEEPIIEMEFTATMTSLPNCPQCNSEYTYEDGSLLICPECAHEWSLEAEAQPEDEAKVIKDANGNVLSDGDSVTVIKDLKVKGTSLVVKIGTKVKNIRLIDGDHDIDCKIDGFGAMKLKSEFVKKN